MPQLRTRVEHSLSPFEAKARLEALIESLPVQFPSQFRNVNARWNNFSLHLSFDTYGFRVEWEMSLLPKGIDIIGTYPVSARMFEHKIEQTIVSRLEHALSEAMVQRRAA